MTSDSRPRLNLARPSMYDEQFIAPMRRELTDIGFRELHSADEVDETLPNAKGTAMVVVNSMCGCAARNARPAVRRALAGGKRPDHLFTVFAGQDPEPTQRAREYFTGYAPSSPSVALLRDGSLVWMLERWQIEGRPADEIAADLTAALEEYCNT
jgi:putative YphP/YqiW family bacilliredoxin